MTERFSLGRLLCPINNAVIVWQPVGLIRDPDMSCYQTIRYNIQDVNYTKLPPDYNLIRLPSTFVLNVSVKDVWWMLSPHWIILNMIYRFKFCFHNLALQLRTGRDNPVVDKITD